MKTLSLLLLSLFATSTYSQCSDVVKSKYDEFDKTTLNEADIILRNENGVEFKISLSFIVNENTQGRTPYVRVNAHLNEGSNPTNVGGNPYIHFLFEDGSSEILYGGDHFGNYFASLIWLSSFDPKSAGRLQAYEAVKNKKLKAIRFNKDHDKYDFQLTSQQKEKIQKVFSCITQ